MWWGREKVGECRTETQNISVPQAPYSNPAMGGGERKVQNENNNREKPSCNRTRQERSEGAAERPSCANGSRRKQEGFGGKEEARPLFARFSLNNGCCCCCCLRPSVGVWRRLLLLHIRSLSRTRAHKHTHLPVPLRKRPRSYPRRGTFFPPPISLPRSRSCSDRRNEGGICYAKAERKTKGRGRVRQKEEVNPQGGRETTQRKDQRREGKGRS